MAKRSQKTERRPFGWFFGVGRTAESREEAAGGPACARRLLYESLEDRKLLSVSADSVLPLGQSDLDATAAPIESDDLSVDYIDAALGGADSAPRDFALFEGRLYFVADDGASGEELWEYDGAALTLIDIVAGAAGSNPTSLVSKNGELYFGANATELWKYDGTTATLVEDMGGTSPDDFIRYRNLLYFQADNGVNGLELMRYNGVSTTLVEDINPGAADSWAGGLAIWNGYLYFQADDGANGMELWRSDGGSATLVKDLNPGASGSDPIEMTVYDGDLYFAADDGTSGPELWRLSSGGVLDNDLDINGSPLTATLVTDVANGTLTLDSLGGFVYTPTPGFAGTDSFTYKTNDGTTDSDIVTVTLSVNGANAAPVAVSDSYSTNEGQLLSVAAAGVLANDSDANADPLTAVLVTDVSDGTLALDSTGSFTYTPNAAFHGTDSFTYKANDGATDSNTVTVSIAVNATPTPTADSYATNQGQALNVAAPGVLANDTDAEGDPLTAVLVDNVHNGSLSFLADGSFSYTPDAAFVGTDGFTYHANDGADDSADISVTITVGLGNTVPVAVVESYVTDEDVPVVVHAASGILANDLDADGDPLTWILVTDVTHGNLSLAADGSFTYTPDANYFGLDHFIYRVTDGQAESNLVMIPFRILPVNDAPTPSSDGYTIERNQTLTIGPAGVLGNDLDVESDPITATLVVDVAHGALVFSADGSFDYTPELDFVGVNTFTYTANDGLLDSVEVTVGLTVTQGNRAPVAGRDYYTVDEDQVLSVPIAGVLANDTDPDGDSLDALRVTDVVNGILTFSMAGWFNYTPNADFFGTDSFTYTANDGLLDSNVATVVITVHQVNDLPVLSDMNFQVNRNASLSVAANAGVLTGVIGSEGDLLTASVVSFPANGDVSLASDGSFAYIPDANYFGSDSFQFRAYDGEFYSAPATATINVLAVNNRPTADDDQYLVNEDETLTVAASGVLVGDTDLDSDGLTAVLESNVAHGQLTLDPDGSFVYTPDADFAGTDQFQYRANDGTNDSTIATVSLIVLPSADAPAAADDQFVVERDVTLVTTAAAGVLANDLTDSGGPLTASLVAGPTHGTLTLAPDGSLTYTPTPGYQGADSFTYRAFDGQEYSQVATALIDVVAVNQPPVGSTDTYATGEDQALSVLSAAGVLANDTDPEGSRLAAVLAAGPSNGFLRLFDDGSFYYEPNLDFFGVDQFSYQTNDGQHDSGVTLVTINVTSANDAPTIQADAYSADEDTPLVVDAASGLLANDTDVDGDPLTATLVRQAAHGVVALNADGSFTYTPEADYFGEDSFAYENSDGTLTSPEAEVTLNVRPGVDPPVAVDDSYVAFENGQLQIDTAVGVLQNDTDDDRRVLSAVLDTDVAHGSLLLAINGSFVYTPEADFQGWTRSPTMRTRWVSFPIPPR